MRISTAQFYESSAANYQKNFANVVKSSEEASSLIRVNTAADDPVGASHLLQLGQQASMLDQYSANITTIKATLGTTEAVMTSIGNVLQRAKELALGAGSGIFTDADRQANAAELEQIEEQLLGLMNTKDESGKYIFAGSKGDTAPFSRNSDGTYSYNGDQTTLNLPVGDSMSMATNSTGWEVFQQAINTSRSQTDLAAPAVDDGRVLLSDGLVSSSANYNNRFRSGEPYTVEFVSSTQFKITDVKGNDVTSESSQNGVISSKDATTQSFSFRGLDLSLNIKLKAGDTDPDAMIAGHSFSLSSKPDSFNATRSPGNPSTAQITASTVIKPEDYTGSFPAGGAILKFTSASNYELYASPITADSKPVSEGSLDGSTAKAAGVDFTLSGAPQAGDQYVIAVNNHQTQNILDTVSQLRTALLAPVDSDPVLAERFSTELNAGIANLTSGSEQLSSALSSVGGRGAALDTQSEANGSIALANKQTQSAIRDSDPAEVMTRLTLQQTMLQASQLAFSKLASLGLFNRL
ncbi:flagellar hook-associated protein 3 [Pseudomonas silesiensis]|uniref:flagellar hook-associated protein 3 n=1 Tax=Pseudomonas silesiensis TaxID=1853130 RepID=UPI0030CE00E2